ncbi:MAG TPA: hypothetical protein VEA38_09220 [Terriglobales bacterium]|nr:hypothetical protein [Terriglobales bacterium]
MLTKAQIAEYADTFPSVDIVATLKRIRQWLRDDPRRLNGTPTGLRKRISTWLGKEQDAASRIGNGRPARRPSGGGYEAL